MSEHLAGDRGDEGPLDSYLGSIATPPAWKEVHILEGYAHLDVTSAEHNEAVPLIADFIRRVKRIPPSRR